MQQLNYLCCTSNLILSGGVFNEALNICYFVFPRLFSFTSLGNLSG